MEKNYEIIFSGNVH